MTDKKDEESKRGVYTTGNDSGSGAERELSAVTALCDGWSVSISRFVTFSKNSVSPRSAAAASRLQPPCFTSATDGCNEVPSALPAGGGDIGLGRVRVS